MGLVIVVLIAGAVSVRTGARGAVGGGSRPAALPGPLRAELRVSGPAGRPVPESFVGLSFEDWTFGSAAGVGGPADPLLPRLIGGLSAHGPALIRIGGNSGDQVVAAGSGSGPGTLGVRYVVDGAWMRRLAAVLRSGHARVELGLNFARLPLGRAAAAELALARRSLPPSVFAAIALGNEPDYYSHNRWARTATGRLVGSRPRGWSFARFLKEYATAVGRLPAGGPPLVGPDLAGVLWLQRLRVFAHSVSRVRGLNLHEYALSACRRGARLSIRRLLDPRGAQALAARIVTARRLGAGLPVRVSEGNSVACRGRRGVSDSMASALWATDLLFRVARAGGAGFTFHSSGASYDPFVVRRVHRRWTAAVRPLYYGLLAFERAVGPGSRLMAVAGRRPEALRVWATTDRVGHTRLLVLDTDPRRAARFRIRVPAVSGRVALLTRGHGAAPTFGGRSFGVWSRDARLHGPTHEGVVAAVHGVLTLRVPPMSEAVVLLRR